MSFRKASVGMMLVLACYLSGQAARAQEVALRDLSGYENGGKFQLLYFYGQTPEDEAEVLAHARKLLWRQWREKRRAHFALVKVYTHGDSTTINYYVEPDGEGRWRVAVEYVSDCCSNDAIMGKARVREITRANSYYIVNRMDAANGRALRDGEVRRPETYTITLLNGKLPAPPKAGASHSDVL